MATMTTPDLALPSAMPTESASKTSRSTGTRKAAILLTSIGDEDCAALLRGMTEDEVHQVTREISRLGPVSEEERQSVFDDFTVAVQMPQYRSGGIDFATSVLITAFGPETGKRMAERVLKSLGSDLASINSLQKTDPQQLAKVVQREQPQTIALVLSHVGPAHAAKLLSALPRDVRADVLLRMALLDQISPEVVTKIARTLDARLRSLGESSLESYGGVRAVAEVLNRVDSSTSNEILKEITDEDANLGQTIQNLMFVFDDLTRVDEASMRTLIGAVDRKVLGTALKGVSAELRRKFTSFMSTRASEMLTEDMEAMGPMRIRDVEEAQHAIIAIARQLEAQGTVSLRPSSGNEFVV